MLAPFKTSLDGRCGGIADIWWRLISVLCAFAATRVGGDDGTDDGGCTVRHKLDGLHCYGLAPDKKSQTGDACSDACCADVGCEVWQYHPVEGCFRGKSGMCIQAQSTFSQNSVGARLRNLGYDTPRQSRPGSGFNTQESIEPYGSGPDVQTYMTADGQTWLVRRFGPKVEQLHISASCWAESRLPTTCCNPDEPVNCWSPYVGDREHCCRKGAGNFLQDAIYYDVRVEVSSRLSRELLEEWHALLPKPPIVDERVFEEKSRRWRIGAHEPAEFCPAAEDSDSAFALRPLVSLLAAAGYPLSRTFVNIGAGTCGFPDPLHELAHSEIGRGFVGLAVDANPKDLRQCTSVLQNASSGFEARLLHVAATPSEVVAALRPHFARLFGLKGQPDLEQGRWPLDILVVDIDGCDCLVTEELLQLVQPKALMVEMAFHIPPPFRFTAHYDASRSPEWQKNYDVTHLDPSTGCSLSYALHHFRPYGYHLLRLTRSDAIFVHESIVPIIERVNGVRFPQDEFACFRRSIPWMQLPTAYVREWFFAEHPALAFGNVWSNITWMSRDVNRPDAPFSLDY